jgi:cobalamin synthase
MAEKERRGTLSFGVFLIIIVIAILLYTPLGLIDWTLILPFVLALFGCWIMALAGIRASNPQKYERGPFSTLVWGLLMTTLGGSWFLYAYTSNSLYALALILLVLAIVAIVAALKRK